MPPMSDTHGISRAEMLRRISAALGRSKPQDQPPAPPQVDDALVRLAPPDADLLLLFAERAGEVGMFVRRCMSADLSESLINLLREIDAKTAAVAVPRLAQRASLIEAMQAAGIQLIEWRNDSTMAPLYETHVGITDVHAALAETGTLVCRSDDDHGRGLSLVTPVHVAIVRRSDIVPDMLDYLPDQGDIPSSALPSAQALITGPSKTADIEGVLVTGVHGPGKVFILLVEDE